jgi:preprotein translocase subunit SecA
VRKRTLEFDDVMNRQRSVVYELRGRVLRGDQATVHNLVLDVMNDLIINQAERFLFSEKDGNLGDFMSWLSVTFPIIVTEDELKPFLGNPAEAAKFVMNRVEEAYEMKCAGEDQEVLPFMERGVFLQVIDREWQDYLRAMDDLRHGVNLRAYGQRDPLIEYKKEAFGMFESLMSSIKTKVDSSEFRSATASRMQAMFSRLEQRRMMTNEDSISVDGDRGFGGEAVDVEEVPSSAKPSPTVADVFASMMSQAAAAPVRQTAVRSDAAAGRNDPCPCGSGKKYKKCCGRNLI